MSAAAFLVAALVSPVVVGTALAESNAVADAGLRSVQIPAFNLRQPEQRRFGRLTFAGGLSVRASNPHVGAFSGLAVSSDNTVLAVSDTGFWMTARVERDAANRPVGLSRGRIAPLLDPRGEAFGNKWGADAEGLTLRNGRAFISMEQHARILSYPRAENGDIEGQARTIVSTFPEPRLRSSFGLESIVALPGGRLLVIAEGTPNDTGPARAFLVGISGTEELAVARRDGFYITDAALLPVSGDVVLLERNFTPSRGPEMRLRLIERDAIIAGATVDGEVLLSVGRGYALDNMEGISAFVDADGATRIAIISDDNHWALQRTLYLEFTLDEASSAQAVRRASKP